MMILTEFLESGSLDHFLQVHLLKIFLMFVFLLGIFVASHKFPESPILFVWVRWNFKQLKTSK